MYQDVHVRNCGTCEIFWIFESETCESEAESYENENENDESDENGKDENENDEKGGDPNYETCELGEMRSFGLLTLHVILCVVPSCLIFENGG
jgi:hypothetical protein